MNISKSSSLSCGSSCTSGRGRFADFRPMNVGDEGLSVDGVFRDTSMDEAELEYLSWHRVEKVGVTGDGISDADELCV